MEGMAQFAAFTGTGPSRTSLRLIFYQETRLVYVFDSACGSCVDLIDKLGDEVRLYCMFSPAASLQYTKDV